MVVKVHLQHLYKGADFGNWNGRQKWALANAKTLPVSRQPMNSTVRIPQNVKITTGWSELAHPAVAVVTKSDAIVDMGAATGSAESSGFSTPCH